MKLKSLLITTCLTATTLFIQSPLQAQTDTPAASATPGAPPKFGPESQPGEKEHGHHDGHEGHQGKHNPEERLAHMKQALGLSADQEAKIREIFNNEMAKMHGQHKANKGTEPSAKDIAKREAARSEVEAAVKAVLTPEQQTKWEAMKKDWKNHPKPEAGAPVPKP